jgi:hypothetical protein
MNHLSVGHFIIIGLLFWGLPAVFVVGPQAILYTLVAVLFVWLLSRRSPAMNIGTEPAERTGSTAAFILVACALFYFLGDAAFGQKLLAVNLFLHGVTAVDRVVDQANLGVSQGRGIVALLGTIVGLLPYYLIDVADRARRFDRLALWSAAFLLLFYGVTTSRGAVIISILTIVMRKTSNWRRISIAGGVAFAFFTLASALRGDLVTSRNPLGEAIEAPYVNLLLMHAAHCGSAPWYNYVA